MFVLHNKGVQGNGLPEGYISISKNVVYFSPNSIDKKPFIGEFVDVYVDEQAKKVGFKFLAKSSGTSYKLSKNEKSKGRRVQIQRVVKKHKIPSGRYKYTIEEGLVVIEYGGRDT